MRHISHVHCPRNGRTRFCSAHFRRIVFLDVRVLLSEMEALSSVDSRLYAFTSPNDPLLTIILTDCNTIANIAALASADWACAVQVMAAVSIGSDLTFQATSAQTLSAANHLLDNRALTFALQWSIFSYPSCPHFDLYTQPSRHSALAKTLHRPRHPVRTSLPSNSIRLNPLKPKV